MLKEDQILSAFRSWGFVSKGETSDQYYGHCPFCHKTKLYISKTKGLWDCKVCGISGNYLKYLETVSKKALPLSEDLNRANKLCVDRKLPLSAFQSFEIKLWDDRYILPVRGINNVFQDLRYYVLKGKVRSSLGCQVGLLGAEKVGRNPSIPIYVCEGEWDAFALKWLLGFTKNPGEVVAVPGANVFKTEWVSLFEGRNAFLCYDNDAAGETGEQTAFERIAGTARTVKFLKWSDSLPSGFDVRDYVVQVALKERKPKKCFRTFEAMFRTNPRKVAANLTSTDATVPNPEIPDAYVSLREVQETFGKWLFMKDFKSIEVLMATVLSNWIQGDPLWMFFVAPPGGSKTEIINSLSGCPDIYFTSSLTPHSLISGANWQAGRDPSLIPTLDKKVLAIKDFTTILDGKESDKEETFGILRDAYDGYCGKVFGNGVRRHYKSSFTVVSGVTEQIYKHGSHQQALGERFLKYCIEDSLNRPHEEEIILRAISNLSSENKMREEIARKTHQFVLWHRKRIPENPKEYPTISEVYRHKLMALAMFGARMRGVVARDKYRTDLIDSRPSAELGTRLSKQLAKLAISLAFVNERKQIGEDDYRLCKKVMLGTLSQRNEDVVSMLLQKCPTPDDSLRTKDLSYLTNYTQSTISRVLSDMSMLQIVTRTGGKANSYNWTVSKYMRDLIEKSEVYV